MSFKDSSLRGCDTMLLCKMLLTFQRIKVLATSDSSILWWPDHEEEVTMAIWNNRKYSPNDTVSHHTGPQSSSTPMWNIRILHRVCSGTYMFPFFRWKVTDATTELGLIKIFSVTGLFTAQQREHTHLLSSCPLMSACPLMSGCPLMSACPPISACPLLSACPLNIEKPRSPSSSLDCIAGLLFDCTSRGDFCATCFFSLQQP